MNTVFSDAICTWILLYRFECHGGDCPKTHKLGSANFQIVIDDSVFLTSASCSILDLQCKTIESEVGSFRLKGKSKTEIVLGRPGRGAV